MIGNIEEKGITIGGIPAKKISDNDSSLHLIRATEIRSGDLMFKEIKANEL